MLVAFFNVFSLTSLQYFTGQLFNPTAPLLTSLHFNYCLQRHDLFWRVLQTLNSTILLQMWNATNKSRIRAVLFRLPQQVGVLLYICLYTYFTHIRVYSIVHTIFKSIYLFWIFIIFFIIFSLNSNCCHWWVPSWVSFSSIKGRPRGIAVLSLCYCTVKISIKLLINSMKISVAWTIFLSPFLSNASL